MHAFVLCHKHALIPCANAFMNTLNHDFFVCSYHHVCMCWVQLLDVCMCMREYMHVQIAHWYLHQEDTSMRLWIYIEYIHTQMRPYMQVKYIVIFEGANMARMCVTRCILFYNVFVHGACAHAEMCTWSLEYIANPHMDCHEHGEYTSMAWKQYQGRLLQERAINQESEVNRCCCALYVGMNIKNIPLMRHATPMILYHVLHTWA